MHAFAALGKVAWAGKPGKFGVNIWRIHTHEFI